MNFHASLSLSSSLLLALFSALARESHGQLSMVPEGLLDNIPEVCMQQLSEEVLPCAIENSCFSLLPTQEEMDAIPDESEIMSCADIDAALCPITTRCEACKPLADEFFRCSILNNDMDISANITDLVMDCSLACVPEVGEDELDPTMAPTPTAAPDAVAAVPTSVLGSGELSGAPSDGVDAADVTDAPTETATSGAANRVVSLFGAMLVLGTATASTLLM
eukprot:jgi/Psemu1/306072/fgenesh1_kg.232_\